MPREPTLRAAAAFCATAAVFIYCFLMLREAIGSESPWLGLLLMFDFLGLARIGQPLFVFRMPGFLREVRPWEAEGGSYKRLGVQQFGQLLRASPARFLNTSVYLAGRKRDLQSLYWYAASSEAVHFWCALLFTPYIVFVWARGHGGVAAFFLFIQVLFNVYPILHLRLLRGRLDARLAKRVGRVATQ